MNVNIGTEAPKFLFWEYLFKIFGILSLQCMSSKGFRKNIYAVIFVHNEMLELRDINCPAIHAAWTLCNILYCAVPQHRNKQCQP
jgi:hypothetical protein